MTKLKKIKKWASRTHRDVERAERAADRAELALRQVTELRATTVPGSSETAVARSPIYTGAAGHDETPAAAAVANLKQRAAGRVMPR
jgi:hypothetical protein